MTFFCPSYGRAGKTLTDKWLPEVRMCVHECEAASFPDVGRILMPDELRGNIARVRNWIIEYAGMLGLREFAIMDDDIRSVGRWVTHKKRTKFTADKFREFVEAGFLLAREWGVSLWGVNPDNGKGAFRENTPFSLSSYISGSFCGMISPVTRYDESLPLKEDYDYCLQELNRHRRILRINRVSLNKSDHKNRGGCAAYRTIIAEQEQMTALQRKWGSDIVRADKGKCRTHRKGGAPLLDINPIIRVPIGGV